MEKCDHGLVFDEEEAKKILNGDDSTKLMPVSEAMRELMSRTQKLRKRFPRLHGKCPKGCGFEGIAYASQIHFIYGDW